MAKEKKVKPKKIKEKKVLNIPRFTSKEKKEFDKRKKRIKYKIIQNL